MLPRIIDALYGSVWAILPETHRALGESLQAYLNGGGPAMALGNATAPPPPPPGVVIDGGFAFLQVKGIIARHLSMMETMCGGYDTLLLERQFLELSARDDVHTIVTDFYTPGGLAMGLDELARLIAEVGESKRTVAWVEMAASAGYYLAAAHNSVYASPTGLAGNIGTYSAITDESRHWEMEGKTLHVFKSAPGKARAINGSRITEEDKAFFQGRAADLGSRFKSFVIERRPLVTDAALSGDYGCADDAIAEGLVDECFLSKSHMLAALLTDDAA